MQNFISEIGFPLAKHVVVTEDTLKVDLVDGRTISVPILWYPRLANGTKKERNHWELIGEGDGIHWPDLDEDISVEGLLDGRMSGEGPGSLQFWLDNRAKGRKVTLADYVRHRRKIKAAEGKRRKSA